MSLEKIVAEALAGRPLEMKEAFEAEIQTRIQARLEAEYMDVLESKDDDLDEEALDFIDAMLDEGYGLDDAINAIVDQELEEGSIKGSGTDRKAQLKKSYRAGEQKTRDFYKNKMTSAPRTADKGVKKAFAAGAGAGDGSPTVQGSKRSSSQDSLKGTKHDQSSVSPTSKSFRSTHSTKMYGLRKKPNLPESFDLSDYTVDEIEEFMQTEDYENLDELSRDALKKYRDEDSSEPVEEARYYYAGKAYNTKPDFLKKMDKEKKEKEKRERESNQGIQTATRKIGDR